MLPAARAPSASVGVGSQGCRRASKLEIGAKTAPWGISVTSVEIRDVAIPEAMQNATSRQARAEREKQARVILGLAEAAIADQFVEAANITRGTPGRCNCVR